MFVELIAISEAEHVALTLKSQIVRYAMHVLVAIYTSNCDLCFF
jgi:hypothetical protein